jgi:hypothetical protein
VNSADHRALPGEPRHHFAPTFTARPMPIKVRRCPKKMPQYVFRIRQGTDSSDVPVDLADHDAAWHEGAKVCSDLIRDGVARLRDSPEWRLEVCDETGEPVHLFRLTAETFKNG